MSRRATGTFEVKLTPQSLAHPQTDSTLGRMSMSKVFSGELQGTSVGEMLSTGSPAKGSAGYVAIEHVQGTLHGRSGNFVLQHSGTMNRGALELSVKVVPDSGTEGLAGITGVFDIQIVDGKHLYTLDYALQQAD